MSMRQDREQMRWDHSPLSEPDTSLPPMAKPTLTGVLLLHRGHELVPASHYVIPAGHVYGQPHLMLWCATCHDEVWDAPI